MTTWLCWGAYVCCEYQEHSIKKRETKGIMLARKNKYQLGDFVTFDAGSKPTLKMSCRMKGSVV